MPVQVQAQVQHRPAVTQCSARRSSVIAVQRAKPEPEVLAHWLSVTCLVYDAVEKSTDEVEVVAPSRLTHALIGNIGNIFAALP
jgi:hypothetical protein